MSRKEPNPRKGIETQDLIVSSTSPPPVGKNLILERGLKHTIIIIIVLIVTYRVGKNLILERGLKLAASAIENLSLNIKSERT